MAHALILGGTRDIGYAAASALLETGHGVTVLNRGHTPDDLPGEVERLRADRSNPESMRAAIGSRAFDIVLDTTTYDAANAQQAVDVFAGRVRRYVFISTGQVYLVRAAIERPFREADFDGPLIDEPEPGTSDHDSWRYGVDKREAEEVFGAAWAANGFPVTTLRIPVVASERDPGARVQAYLARLHDGGPILVPDDRGLPLRHLYVGDLARLIVGLAGSDAGIGSAFNVSSDISMQLSGFIELLGSVTGKRPAIVRVPRTTLEKRGLLPDCSPFSSRWMSELDNEFGLPIVNAAGMSYSSPTQYLERIARDFVTRWRASGLVPVGYHQRDTELALAREFDSRQSTGDE